MTNEQQIKAIAELDGWTHLYEQDFTDSLHCHWREWFGMMPDGKTHDQKVPNYSTSRDAIIPVIEKQLFNNNTFIKNLCVCCGIPIFGLVDVPPHKLMLKLILATPSQLCEALLRATGKWSN